MLTIELRTACASDRRSRWVLLVGAQRRRDVADRRLHHGSTCSASIMKRRNSFAPSVLVYLKIIWLKNSWNSGRRGPTGPTGMLAC